MVMKMRVAKIGINQEDFFAKLSKGICQVGHQCGFAIAKGGAADLDDFPVLRKVAKKRCGSDPPIGLCSGRVRTDIREGKGFATIAVDRAVKGAV